MSLPPETVGLVSDFLAALGKWESDNSELRAQEKVESVGKTIRRDYIMGTLGRIDR